MPQFFISGMDAAGKQVTRTIQAADRSDAGRKALDQEILVQAIRPVDRRRYNLKPAEKLNFIRLLSVTTASGLPILRGLNTILLESGTGALNRLTVEMISDLEEGASISEAMEKREGVFEGLAISLVRAGEASGSLSTTLRQLFEYEESAFNFRKKLRGALSYPVVVFTFAIGVMAFFIGFIVPRFRDTYSSFGGDLPFATQLLLFVSDAFREYYPFLLALAGGGVAAVLWFMRSGKYRIVLEKIFLRIPVFGQVYLWSMFVKFGRTLGTLTENQVNFLDSLFLSVEAAGSAWFSGAMKPTVDDIRQGVGVTDAFEKTGIFPELALQMVRMGEESGRLSQLMLSMSDFYQKNMEHRVSTIESVIQPVVVVGLGVFIGFLVIALFLPMFDLPGIIK